MLDAIGKYMTFLRSKHKEYSRHLERRHELLIQSRKAAMEERLYRHFPYPLSHVFFSFQHEMDHHRRFQSLLQVYEVAIKYAAIVGLAGWLSTKEVTPAVADLLQTRLTRPSLGDWGKLLVLLLNESAGFESLLEPATRKHVLGHRSGYLDERSQRTNLQDALSQIVSKCGCIPSSIGWGFWRPLIPFSCSLLTTMSSAKAIATRSGCSRA